MPKMKPVEWSGGVIRTFAAACTVLCLCAASGELDSPTAFAGSPKRAFCSQPRLDVGDSPSKFEARMAVSKAAISPGEGLKVRVENVGTSSIAYGYSYRLARKSGSSWQEMPVGPFYGARLVTPAAAAGPCQQVEIGQDPRAGRYRLEKKAWLAERGIQSARRITITFKVADGATHR
jgi:hypothetical protein